MLLPPRATIGGCPVGWLTLAQAEARLAEYLKWPERKIAFIGTNGQVSMYYRDLGIQPDIRSSVRLCRPALRELLLPWKLLRARDCPIVITVDREKLYRTLSQIRNGFLEPPRDATFDISDDGVVRVLPHRNGLDVDVERLGQLVTGGGTLGQIPDRIYIPYRTLEPTVASEELEKWLPLSLIASHATFFEPGNDRAANIELASKALDGFTVRPDQIFSFNEVVGPRSGDKGYRKAPVIVGDRMIDDYGGGVCQVSTTVYIALLKAGFEVIERHNHGIPVSYVPLGMDATVVYGLLDLKMRNMSGGPAIISVRPENGQLIVSVYGKPSDTEIVIESRILEEVHAADTQNPAGADVAEQKLRNGYLVETLRKYLKSGQVVRVERLNTSWYPPEQPASRPTGDTR